MMLEKLNFIAPQEMQKARMDICFLCSELGTVLATGIAKCKACGCAIRGKVVLKTSTCPLGKWEAAPVDVTIVVESLSSGGHTL